MSLAKVAKKRDEVKDLKMQLKYDITYLKTSVYPERDP